jgi:hypothetical protein
MTDYRPRNHHLLYAPRSKRPLDRRVIAIFGLIGAVVTLGVVSHLAERPSVATPGFVVARQPAPAAPIQVATPVAAIEFISAKTGSARPD